MRKMCILGIILAVSLTSGCSSRNVVDTSTSTSSNSQTLVEEKSDLKKSDYSQTENSLISSSKVEDIWQSEPESSDEDHDIWQSDSESSNKDDNSEKNILLAYGICKNNCTVISADEEYELYKGQQIGIVSYEENDLLIAWYNSTAKVSADFIEIYPETYEPNFETGQWAGVITN